MHRGHCGDSPFKQGVEMKDFSVTGHVFVDVKDSPEVEGLTKARFLAWEPLQPTRYEYRGEQPVPVTPLSPRASALAFDLGMMLQYHLCHPWRVHGTSSAADVGASICRPDVFVSDNRMSRMATHSIPIVTFDFIAFHAMGEGSFIQWHKYLVSERPLKCIFLTEEGEDCLVMTRVAKLEWHLETVSIENDLLIPELSIALPFGKIYKS
jgi:hypothetical protein